ncbi:MAG TPA: efflux RND transporter periplasmic adaptor subunit [Candidatus Paceibacterota bacterium]|nr:efflux RND transporter periplasmic adaptor subunit [Candidatus Paceibacterota bacterium]
MKFFFAAHARLLIAIAAAAVLVGGGYWFITAKQRPAFNSFTVARGNVVESVDVPGNVLTANDVTLSFEQAGQIAHVYIEEGDKVAAGSVLADLDASGLLTQLDEASATFAAAQAKLDGLVNGTRPEQLDIDKSSVASAQAAVQTASNALMAAESGAYTAADDAVRNETDNLFSNPQSENPAFLVSAVDSQLVIDIQAQRIALQTILNNWYAAQNSSSSDPGSLSLVANENMRQVQSYLDAIALVVNGAIPNSTMTASVLAGYKSDVTTARTEISAAITALTTAESGLTSASSALQVAKNQLTLAEAGATAQDIEAQKAAVAEAQAGVESARVALSHAELIAPFAGTVSNLTAKVGQVVSSGAPMLALTNSSGLKIDGYVSEADVAKVSVGGKADVTLDAYGTGTVFSATVATVASTETTVNGSPAYEVTLHFTNPDDRIRAGMTANAHVIAAEHDGVLEVPARLVISANGSQSVLLRNGSASVTQPVTTGLVGDDGMIEITSGLKEGDQIADF